MSRNGLAVIVVLLAIGCGGAPPRWGGSRPPSPLAIGGADGRAYQPLETSGHPATVLVFVLQDCPICNAYAPKIERLAAQYAPRNVPFYLVHVDPSLSDAAAASHAREYKYAFPVLVDRRRELVERLGVRAVPTAVVLDGQGNVQYEGRIDNRYFALGKSRESSTTHELADALAAVTAAKPVAVSRTRVIGCAVPDTPAVSAH